MDRNLPGKSSHRSAPTASSTSNYNRRHGANPSRPFRNSPNPTQTHNYGRVTSTESSRSVDAGNSGESKIGSGRRPTEGEDEGKAQLDAQSIVGTCPFMCPEKERSQRERLRDLAVFERFNGDHTRSASNLAVKKFCRTISSKEVHASDLRPLPVLEDTLNYLMKLLDSSDHPFEVIHDFIFDRTRSIRQDISMQNIFNGRVIWMYEKMVRFHVISHHKLRRCKGDSSIVSSMHHLNKEQLTKCLASLYNLYEVNRNSDSIYDNEAEFRSLYVLLHLDHHTQPMGESLSLWFSRLPSSIIKSKEMSFARRVLRFYRMGNYWRFLGTVASEATYLQFYVVEPFIIEVRTHAIACINSSVYKLHPYPLAQLSKILKMKEANLEYLCNACGLETSQDDTRSKVLPTKQTGFCYPKGGFEYHDFSWLELLKKDHVQAD